MNITTLTTATGLVLGAAITSAGANDQIRPFNRRPNVILIMCDDLGWGDVEYDQRRIPTETPASRFGGPTTTPIPTLNYTPELNDLAASGMRFHRFYAQGPVCSPTRASFLTGRHYHRMGIDGAGQGPLVNRELTMAEIARTQGYITGHFGKWHLGTMSRTKEDGGVLNGINGENTSSAAAGQYSPPWEHGFEEVFSHQIAQQTYYPYARRKGGAPESRVRSLYWTGAGEFIQDLPDTELCAQTGTSSFLNDYTSELLFEEAMGFITTEHLAGAGDPFFITIWAQIGHAAWTSADTNSDVYSCGGVCQGDCDPPGCDRVCRNEDSYYTALREFDAKIGDLIGFLDTNNLRDDTLVVFTSDNGPEGGPGTASTLTGRKRELYEGGIRVPGVFSWPGTIGANAETSTPAVVTDLLPTLMDIWDISNPASIPLDGESILPVLLDGTAQRQNDIFHIYQQAKAYYDSAGQWKAVKQSGSPWELYDLDANEVENNDPMDPGFSNVASGNPAIIGELQIDWNTRYLAIDAQRDAPDYGGSGATDNDYTDAIDTSSGGNIIALSPPDLRSQEFAASDPRIVLERQYATLKDPVVANADASVNTTYTSASLPSGTISVPADTVVHSFLIHHEDPSSVTTEVVDITFDHDILAIIWDEDLLEDSDSLAFADPKIEPDTGEVDDRSTLDTTGDAVQILGTRTIRVTQQAGLGTGGASDRDQVRVLTLAPLQLQPEPCAADLNGDGLLTSADTAAYVALFLAGDPKADVAEDFGILDLDDIDRYTAAYAAGCP